ncbi:MULTISPECIES: ogr/Delta-like zinc finger family protein [unclassified Sphingomonas]|uniref:ogr/Delta-like zinc finger family protein n=1 Tax=unclassified Sphingomonas TaxID=196159 RepID=UPI002269A9F4|nr:MULTISPECIES: ogr/Delta-like zinc finger family protein [unclassified Sphingomonas]
MKKPTAPRLPSIGCPHCGTRSIVRSSEAVTDTVRELRMVCDNTDCGCQFVSQLSVIRIVHQSATPNPAVRIPFGRWPAKPANDDHPAPANDEGLGAALAAIMTIT